jgi:hypothetical protein
MTARARFVMSEETRLDALLLVARHLRRHPGLPEPHGIVVDSYRQRIRLHLLALPDHELTDLLAWHDSLREPVADVWRTSDGQRLLISAVGRTEDDVPVEVFTGMDYRGHLAALGIEPETGQKVALPELALAAARDGLR